MADPASSELTKPSVTAPKKDGGFGRWLRDWKVKLGLGVAAAGTLTATGIDPVDILQDPTGPNGRVDVTGAPSPNRKGQMPIIVQPGVQRPTPVTEKVGNRSYNAEPRADGGLSDAEIMRQHLGAKPEIPDFAVDKAKKDINFKPNDGVVRTPHKHQ